MCVCVMWRSLYRYSNAVVDDIATGPKMTTDEPTATNQTDSTNTHDRKRRSVYVPGHNTCAMVC